MDFRYFMKKALDQAILAYDNKEVPIGAVVVKDGRIIGRGYNRTKALNDPTAHAEIIAITAACETLQEDRLVGCQLYVTVEPCAMCAGAILNSKLEQLIYGANEAKYGACGSVVDLFEKKYFNHLTQVIDGVMANDASSLMQLFFKEKRKELN
jgi:tRNA(adenine34) deaminase